MARLEVELGADIKDLLKDLNKAQQELKDTGKVSLATGKRLQKLGSQGAQGINKYNKATVNALPATQEFSRVIQDAPFGIQGVGNNLQQLTANFGNLSKQAGGSVNAIKAMVSSLAGPAGILLAVSAVTSLLTVYSDEIFNSVGATNKLTEATKEYTAQARAEGIELNTLVGIATNEANSKEVRQRAIDLLNKNYGEYLGNLDLENIKTADLTVNVRKLTEAIVQRAKVEGIKKAITETSADAEENILNAENRRTEAYKNLNAQIDDAIKKNAFLSQVLGNVTDEKERIKQFIELANKYEDVRNVSQSAISAVNEYNASIKNSKKVNAELEASLQNLVTAQQRAQKQLLETEASITPADANDVVIVADLSKIKDRNEKRIKAEKDAAEKRAKILEQINKDNFASELADAEQFVKDIIAVYGNVQADVDPFSGLSESINKSFDDIIRQEERLKATTDVFTSAVGASFSALSQQISSNLATGNAVLDAFVGSLIQSLTQAGAALLQSAIIEGVAGQTKQAVNATTAQVQGVQIATQAATALGPLGLPALPGLIASTQALIGGALAVAKIPKFATGTSSFSGDNNLAFLNGNEMILRPYEISALYNAIRGSGMSNIANNPVNNNLSDGIVGEVVLRGNNQVIQLRRADRKMNRFFNS